MHETPPRRGAPWLPVKSAPPLNPRVSLYCPDCEVYWVSRSRDCWSCGREGKVGYFPGWGNRSDWKADLDVVT